MKRVIASLALLAISTGLFAQEVPKGKLTEGTITYGVTWNLPDQMQAMASSFPTELKVYFKGDSASLKTESQMYNSTSIINSSKDFERLLLDIPMMGKKFSVIFTPADQDMMLAAQPDLTVTPSTESKNISGYNTVKHTVIEKKTNQNSEAWFTKELEATPNPLTRYYGKDYGFPVQFTSYLNGLSINAVVKDVQISPVPAGSFSASKDYEEITFQQLMEMQGGN